MEHVFWMDRDFKAQLCLWAPPCPINLTQFWYTNSCLLEPPNHLIHYGKSCVYYYTTWMTGDNAYNFWQKYRKYKNTKIFASNLILPIQKALQGLSCTRFTPRLLLQRQLNYAKCLVSDVVSNAQNKVLKKRKIDSNPRYGPGHIIKGDKKDIAINIHNSLLILDYKIYAANS